MSDYIQLASIRGTPNRTENGIEMVLDDFYTLCCKNPKNNIGLRLNSRFQDYLIFNSDDVSLEFLCSDFVRFCLSLYKNGQQNASGETKIIPKQPIPISKELQEYMEEFIPDYYGIRDNVKI
jgi:hypothetical protein